MQNSSDGFKWFGERFDGFPKVLPEDCVEYSIYVIDAKLKDFDVRDRLRQVQAAAKTLTKALLKEFIWQREGFKLTLEREAGRSCLHGSTNYGDSVDDEWLVVYILRELSRQFEDIWMRVVDTDGQFLLIEAANALPTWLNPEVADYRVWINNGKLVIIPFEKPGGKNQQNDDGESDNINLEDAVKWIDDPDRKLQHSAKIESEAFFRLRKYPQQITESLHHAIVPLPRKLAYVLHSQPSHVSAAVEAFYLRDPIGMKTLRNKNAGNLIFDPRDLVAMSTTFTKVGYAQLKSQEFSAPAAWASVMKDTIDQSLKSHIDIGMKLACGFEMLMSDQQSRDKQIVREINMLLEDLTNGESGLPSDKEVHHWDLRDESESWLDIDFTQFEKELDGKAGPHRRGNDAGFGDQIAQENLQKMVERFESFLEHDDAGSDGAGFADEMDKDDGEDGSESQSSSMEHNVNDAPDGRSSAPEFVEDEFTAMMRELMGMPAEVLKEVMTNLNVARDHVIDDPDASIAQIDESSRISSADEEEEDIRQAMRQTEKELRDAGVLDLSPEADPH